MTLLQDPPSKLQIGQRLGFCERPIQLRADRELIDRRTGGLIAEQRTDHYVACKTRRQADCVPCSRLYAGDAYQLLRAGLLGGKGVSLAVTRSTAVMVTLTAPGADTFGVGHHYRDKHGNRPCHPGQRGRCPHGRPLSCGQRHDHDDPRLGAPLCDDCFDFERAVDWNHRGLSELWRRWTTYVRRHVDEDRVNVQYARTVEPQRRGLLHVHAIVRFDTTDDTRLSLAEAETAIRRAAAAVRTPQGHTFGTQIDVRPIRTVHDDSTLDHSRAAGYLAKYATASASDLYAKTGPASHHLRRMRDTAARYLRPAEYDRLRRNRRDDGLGITDEDRERVEHRAKRRARELGFTGHYLTKSHHFSVTFTALREARRTFAAPSREPLADYVEESTTWTFISQGYRHEHRDIAVAVRWLTDHHPPGHD